VADVLAVDERHIVVQRIAEVRATPAAAEEFGRALAVTHAAGAAAFGSPPDGWIGDGFIGNQRLAMGHHPSWGGFYAEFRLLPFARAARDRGNLSAAGLTAVEAVCGRLTAGEFDDGRLPARIHGDLWAGNVLYGRSGVVLIDPAAHGGHGQTDLAMLELFGLAQLERVTAAYAEAAELPGDWPERTGLHQLHPLLVHAVSHGAGYGSAAEHTAARYL
jgi:fructosamine-3-kinase